VVYGKKAQTRLELTTEQYVKDRNVKKRDWLMPNLHADFEENGVTLHWKPGVRGGGRVSRKEGKPAGLTTKKEMNTHFKRGLCQGQWDREPEFPAVGVGGGGTVWRKGGPKWREGGTEGENQRERKAEGRTPRLTGSRLSVGGGRVAKLGKSRGGERRRAGNN